jgi:FKBP-type peptidyl-prolyl cis-trans isomerase
MKNVFVLLLFLVLLFPSAFGQKKTSSKTVAQPASPTPPKTILRSMNDSVCYAIGVSVASFYKRQGFDSLDANIVAKAVSDIMDGRSPVFDDMLASNVIMDYMNKKEMEKSKPNIEAGEKFLAENKKRPGVMTTASGLQYEIVKLGTGPKPALSDTVEVHYKGSFIDGNVFESSFETNQPVSFPVGRVIKGWTEALQLMPVGSRYILYVPYQLGYGANDYGTIPGGSTLIFEVELLNIKGKG